MVMSSKDIKYEKQSIYNKYNKQYEKVKGRGYSKYFQSAYLPKTKIGNSNLQTNMASPPTTTAKDKAIGVSVSDVTHW